MSLRGGLRRDSVEIPTKQSPRFILKSEFDPVLSVLSTLKMERPND
jgi:hypothetical protein